MLKRAFFIKLISLILICAFLVTNTAYGIDLSEKSLLRKPLDFNNANGDGRYHSVLLEAGDAKNNAAALQAMNNLSIPRNWEEAANLLLVKKINGADWLNIYKLWTIFDEASRKTNEAVKDIYRNKDPSGIDTAQKRITTVELFGSVLYQAKDGWVNLKYINDIDAGLVVNFIESNADEKEYVDILEYNFKKLLLGYLKDDIGFIQIAYGGDIYLKIYDKIKLVHISSRAETLWWNGANLVSPLVELLCSAANAYHKIIFFLRLTGNPLWPAYLDNVEKLGSADVDTFRNDILVFRDNILDGEEIITKDMIKSRFTPPHMILAASEEDILMPDTPHFYKNPTVSPEASSILRDARKIKEALQNAKTELQSASNL